MTRSLVVALTFAVLAPSTGGCQRDRAERMAASYGSVSKPAYRIAPKAVPQSATGLDAISVEADYEERAASIITEANLAAQLVELEKELGQ